MATGRYILRTSSFRSFWLLLETALHAFTFRGLDVFCVLSCIISLWFLTLTLHYCRVGNVWQIRKLLLITPEYECFESCAEKALKKGIKRNVEKQ